MAEETTKADQISNTGWMSDVQRAIALILILTFAFVTILSTVCSIFWPSAVAVTDMAKSLQSNLTNMGLIALGFFFGNTMAKMAQDAGQQKVVDKLTSAPPNGPVAPVPSPTAAEVAWWNKMTDAERAAITAAASADPTDQKLGAIVSGPVKMKPDQEEIAFLVSKGLLTSERAKAIQSA